MVIDTSVILDFHRGELLPSLFELPYCFLAPDTIISELKRPPGLFVSVLGLHPYSLTGEQVLSATRLRNEHRGLSVADLHAFVLARALGLTLLTGDKLLRRLAQENNVTVHGTLWLLDKLVCQEVVTPPRAAAALRQMLERGARLPKDPCEKRLTTWEAARPTTSD